MVKKRNREELPDVNITLTARELKALVNEPPELMKLYIFLNFHRDFLTNTTGKVWRIDDAKFKEWMDYPGKPGRKAWKPSTTHIARWLDQLEDLGLIKQLGNYTFELPFSFSRESVKNISHQNVTNNVTTIVTESDCAQDIENKEENSELKNDLSPHLSPHLSLKVYTPPDNRLDKIRLDARVQEFRQLLIDRGFYKNHLDNTKTIAMIHAWVVAGITVDEAEIAMKSADAQLGKPPDHPTYYRKIPFQYRKHLEETKKQTEEIKHAPTTTRQPTRQHSPNTVNQRVYAAIAALPEEWDD